MVREIVKDEQQLKQVCNMVNSTEFQFAELYEIITDLEDYAKYYANTDVNEQGCAGLAANQIGYQKKVVICFINKKWQIMINPIITKASKNKVESEEGCLSLEGTRKVMRHTWIEVCFIDKFKKSKKFKLSAFNAIVVQHEIDHTLGKII